MIDLLLCHYWPDAACELATVAAIDGRLDTTVALISDLTMGEMVCAIVLGRGLETER